MKKYGWEWRTVEGQDKWKKILFTIIGAQGNVFNNIQQLLGLADDLIRHEDAYPDSFQILAVLGTIYSSAAIANIKDKPLSASFLSKAEDVQNLSRKYVVNGQVSDPESQDEVVNQSNIDSFYLTACYIGVCKYILGNSQDIDLLNQIRKYYDITKLTHPDDPAIKTIQRVFNKKTADNVTTSPADASQKKRGCFIATAVYGSPMASEVVLLKEFRDEVLLRSRLGQRFVDVYYHVSPFMARLLQRCIPLKILVRLALLTPITWCIKTLKHRIRD